MAKGNSPYQGKWTAKNSGTGQTVAEIRIDGKEQVWVNEVKVKAKRTDGALQFRQGMILYTLQGDPTYAAKAAGRIRMPARPALSPLNKSVSPFR